MPSVIAAGTTSNTALNFTADTTGVLQLQTNGTTAALTIDTSQNVGIGTASPAMAFHVVKNWTGGKATVGAQTSTSFASGGIAGFGAFDSDGSRALYWYSDNNSAYVYNAKNTALIFGTNDTERMRIDSSGNVLIGQTSQVINEKLLVRDNAASSVNIRVRNDSTSASAGAAIGLNASGNTWGIECGSSAKNSNALTWLLDYGGTNQERLRLNTDGTLILRGGSTSATGTGITFPATQSASSDANTLDDYEEGTWTPTVGGNATYNTRNGVYIKIGNLVWIYGFIDINTIGTGNTNNISGLPFSNGGSGAWEATIPVDKSQNLSTSITWMALRPSGTSLYAVTRTGASTSGNINAVFLTNGSVVQFAGCYSV